MANTMRDSSMDACPLRTILEMYVNLQLIDEMVKIVGAQGRWAVSLGIGPLAI